MSQIVFMILIFYYLEHVQCTINKYNHVEYQLKQCYERIIELNLSSMTGSKIAMPIANLLPHFMQNTVVNFSKALWSVFWALQLFSVTGRSQTPSLTNHQKKSMGFRSGGLGGHFIWPPHQFHLLGRSSSRYFTLLWQYGGAPSR
jgi:hypothetical protein